MKLKLNGEEASIRRARLEQAIQMTGLSQTAFARKVGLFPGDLSKARSGADGKYPSDVMIRSIAGTDFEGVKFLASWLMGEGDVPTAGDMQQVRRFYRMMHDLTAESHAFSAKRNLLQIIRARAKHEGDVSIILLADDVESYAIHKVRNYIRCKKLGYT